MLMFDKYEIENEHLSIIKKKQYDAFVREIKKKITIVYSNDKKNNKTIMTNDDEFVIKNDDENEMKK